MCALKGGKLEGGIICGRLFLKYFLLHAVQVFHLVMIYSRNLSKLIFFERIQADNAHW